VVTPDRHQQSDRLVRWARWLTGGWLALGALVAFLKRDTIPDLALNDIGDAVAGLCAPIAFLWLVVTALLQKSELEAQRSELRQNREALLLQVQQLGSSAEQQAAQTRIMRDQYERALQDSLTSQLRRILIDDHSWYMSELSGIGVLRLPCIENGGPAVVELDFGNELARLVAEGRISEAVIGVDRLIDQALGLITAPGRSFDRRAAEPLQPLAATVSGFHHSLSGAMKAKDAFQQKAVEAVDYELSVTARIAALARLGARIDAIIGPRPSA
jgi:hypothetical protein